MPIREFKCEDGHVTEKILFGSEDRTILLVRCEHIVEHGADKEGEYEYACDKVARRVEVSASHAQFVEGSGGFHKPTPGAVPTTHSHSAAEDYIKQMKKDSPGGKLINNTWGK